MRRSVAVGQLAAVILVAGACGVNAAPSDDVAAAGASTARVETLTRVAVVDSTPQTFEWRSTAVVDYANDRSEYRDESSGCRTITIGDVTYSELSPDEGFPPGKRWVKSVGEGMDGEAQFEQSQKPTTDEEGGMSAIILFATAEPAPDEYLDYLRDGAGQPEVVGQEDVNGVPTTHYRGDVDVRHRTEAGLETAGWKPANIEAYVRDIQGTRAIDVWVDSEGRARRVVATDKSLGGMANDWVTTTEYFDFGLETDIQAPPAAEVLESGEWERITEEQMRKQLDGYSGEIDEGIEPLPGAFDPSTLSDADSEQPASCLH